jgi:hypothetical protein
MSFDTASPAVGKEQSRTEEPQRGETLDESFAAPRLVAHLARPHGWRHGLQIFRRLRRLICRCPSLTVGLRPHSRCALNADKDVRAPLQSHPVPGGIFTAGMPRMMILWRRATRLGFTWGLKTVRGLGIIAERNAASRALRFAAGL